MELKYKENTLWRIAGIVWLIVAVMNLGLMIFLINGISGGFGFLISPVLLINIILSFLLAVFYFKITAIVYLRLNDKILSIYKGLVLPRKKVILSEIEEGRVIGNRFILILQNGKEVEINLKLLTIRDFERLRTKLGNSFLIID
ncbi:hypothetical protein V1503_00695 [Bacillus sp. SCS-151]|uniref:hypothetical protein n=1 Tax=Nanhaiella sioensis TaxID=3115293 RepID=UPI00397C72B7